MGIWRAPIWASAILMATVPFGQVVRAEPGPDNNLVDLVIDAYLENVRHFDVVESEIEEVSEDSSVTETTVHETKYPDGRIARVTLIPRRARTFNVLAQRDVVKVSIRGEGGGGQQDETHLFEKGRWTYYQPTAAAAWIRRVNKGPSMLSLDPEQVGSDDLNRTLIDSLRQDKLQSAEFVADPKNGRRIQIETADSGGNVTIRYFDEQAGFLPTAFQTRWSDGSLLQSIEYEYQDVLEGRAKFLKQLTRRFYDQGKAQDAASSAWRQQIVRRVTKVTVNAAAPGEDLGIEFAPGTRVTDNIKGAIYQSAFQADATPSTLLSWNVLLTTFVLVSLTATVAVRQWRTECR